jgi:dephospho-CoA kinase
LKFKQGKSVVVLDAPLLYESKVLAWLCYPIIVVHIKEEDIWMSRLKKRDQISTEQAAQKMNAQLAIEKKVEMADIEINNDGTFSHLKNEVMTRALPDMLRKLDMLP